jgi:prephenate dehydrogenase
LGITGTGGIAASMCETLRSLGPEVVTVGSSRPDAGAVMGRTDEIRAQSGAFHAQDIE